MSSIQRNMSLTGEPPKTINVQQKIASAIGLLGLTILVLAILNVDFPNKSLWLTTSLTAIAGGTIWFSIAAYANKHAGIKNDGVYFKSLTSHGFWAWILGIGLTLFYVLLYWFIRSFKPINKWQSRESMVCLRNSLHFGDYSFRN